MSRTLHVRWMVEGPGGYVERRLALPIPSVLSLLLALAFLVYGLELIGGLRRIHAGPIL